MRHLCASSRSSDPRTFEVAFSFIAVYYKLSEVWEGFVHTEKFKPRAGQCMNMEQKLPPRHLLSSHWPSMHLRCWSHSTLISRREEAIMANYCSPWAVWPNFSSLFISKANSSSLFPRLLPYCSVTGYKWKQQGQSKLYFQFSLEVIQTEMLNRPCICPSEAGKIKLPFVFTTAAEEPHSHSQQPIYGPSEAEKGHSFALPGFTQQIFQGMCPIPPVETTVCGS